MERRDHRPHIDQRSAVGLCPEPEIAGTPTRFLADQIRTVDVSFVHGDPVHYLDRDEPAEVEHAVTHYLGL